MPVSGQAAWGPHPITALGQHQMVTALLHLQNLFPYTYPVTLISSGDALALFPQAWATSPQLVGTRSSEASLPGHGEPISNSCYTLPGLPGAGTLSHPLLFSWGD